MVAGAAGARERPLLPARPGAARAAGRAAASRRSSRRHSPRRCAGWRPNRRRCRSRHMGLRFPPVVQFLERFRALLRRRRRFDFDQEAAELTRLEQAVAFLALLELRKAGEIRIEQAGAVRADQSQRRGRASGRLGSGQEPSQTPRKETVRGTSAPPDQHESRRRAGAHAGGAARGRVAAADGGGSRRRRRRRSRARRGGSGAPRRAVRRGPERHRPRARRRRATRSAPRGRRPRHARVSSSARSSVVSRRRRSRPSP